MSLRRKLNCFRLGQAEASLPNLPLVQRPRIKTERMLMSEAACLSKMNAAPAGGMTIHGLPTKIPTTVERMPRTATPSSTPSKTVGT